MIATGFTKDFCFAIGFCRTFAFFYFQMKKPVFESYLRLEVQSASLPSQLVDSASINLLPRFSEWFSLLRDIHIIKAFRVLMVQHVIKYYHEPSSRFSFRSKPSHHLVPGIYTVFRCVVVRNDFWFLFRSRRFRTLI